MWLQYPRTFIQDLILSHIYLVIAALPGPVAHEAQQMPGVEDVEDDEEAAPGVPTARVFAQFRNAYTITRYYSLPSPTSQHTYIRSTDKYLEATFSFLLDHNVVPALTDAGDLSHCLKGEERESQCSDRERGKHFHLQS